jgi:hypothetical protein
MIKAMPALGVPHAHVPLLWVKIFVLEDGGGKMLQQKNAACI